MSLRAQFLKSECLQGIPIEDIRQLSLTMSSQCAQTHIRIFTKKVRVKFERYPKKLRTAVASIYKFSNQIPLLNAVRANKPQMVKYMIEKCDIDLNRRLYTNQRGDFIATPLWEAAYFLSFEVIQVLHEKGADINARCLETGTTPVFQAFKRCEESMVQYLVLLGADTNMPNFSHETILMHAVENYELCQFLLKHNANINFKDLEGRTALFYAVAKDQYETVNLFLQHNADTTITSIYGENILQYACIKQAKNTFNLLIQKLKYSHSELANAYELYGVSYINDENYDNAYKCWACAQWIRVRQDVPKTIPKEDGLKKICIGRAREQEFSYQTFRNQLEMAKLQALLITERVLGPEHPETLKMTIKFMSDDRNRDLINLVDLWESVLEIQVRNHTILHKETFYLLRAIVEKLLDESEEFLVQDDCKSRYSKIKSIYEIVSQSFTKEKYTILESPQCLYQRIYFTKTLCLLWQLVFLLIRYATSYEDMKFCQLNIVKIINRACTSVEDGLYEKLHICPARIADENSLSVMKAYFKDFHMGWWIGQLIDAGGTKSVVLPWNLNGNEETVQLRVRLFHLGRYALCDGNMKCLAAKTVIRDKIPYLGIIPKTMYELMDLHSL